MTVVHPNAVSGINSITVQTGNSLSIHKADGSLLRTITGSTGVTTFATASVGAAWTDFSQGGGLNIGLGASISNGSGNVLTFGTNGDDRATIDSSGRLLHGTASSRSIADGTPNVQVEGTAGTASLGLVRNQNNAGGSNISFAKSRGTSVGSATIVQDDDTLGNINFAAADGTDINTIAASIVAQVDGTPGANDMPGRLIFKTTADGANSATERVRIDSGGNFGIGSNNPQVLLHIASATPTLRIQDTTNNFYSHITVDDSGSLTLDGDAGNGAGSSRIVFKTDGSEHARIDSSGNLIIGDSDGAVGKLSTLGTGNHISASRHSTDTSASNFIFAKYRGSRSSPTVVADGDDLGNLSWYGYNGSSIIKAADITAKTNGTVDGSNMTTDLTFSTTTGNTNTERLRITSDGQIGVNKSSPKAWNASYTSIQIQDAGYIAGSSDDSFVALGANNYLDTGGTYDYTNSDFASQLYQVDGTLVFRNAPSGTADNAITWTNRLSINVSGNATFAGTVSDSKGDLRRVIENEPGGAAYQIVAADAGKFIHHNNTIKMPDSGTLSIGDMVTIYAYGALTLDVTKPGGGEATVYNAADASTGDRTFAARALGTLLCVAADTYVLSGAGIS